MDSLFVYYKYLYIGENYEQNNGKNRQIITRRNL